MFKVEAPKFDVSLTHNEQRHVEWLLWMLGGHLTDDKRGLRRPQWTANWSTKDQDSTHLKVRPGNSVNPLIRPSGFNSFSLHK